MKRKKRKNIIATLSSNLLGSWKACFLPHWWNRWEIIDLSSTLNLQNSDRGSKQINTKSLVQNRQKVTINLFNPTHQDWDNNLLKNLFPSNEAIDSVVSFELSSIWILGPSFGKISSIEGFLSPWPILNWAFSIGIVSCFAFKHCNLTSPCIKKRENRNNSLLANKSQGQQIERK